MKTKCCNAEWRYPVYPSENEGEDVICLKCHRWTTLKREKNCPVCGIDPFVACSECPKLNPHHNET